MRFTSCRPACHQVFRRACSGHQIADRVFHPVSDPVCRQAFPVAGPEAEVADPAAPEVAAEVRAAGPAFPAAVPEAEVADPVVPEVAAEARAAGQAVPAAASMV